MRRNYISLSCLFALVYFLQADIISIFQFFSMCLFQARDSSSNVLDGTDSKAENFAHIHTRGLLSRYDQAMGKSDHDLAVFSRPSVVTLACYMFYLDFRIDILNDKWSN